MAEDIHLGLLVELKDKTAEGFEGVASKAEGLAKGIEGVGKRIAGSFEGIGAPLGSLGSKFSAAEGQVSQAFGKMLTSAEGALKGIGSAAEQATAGIGKVVSGVAQLAAPVALVGAAGVAAATTLGVTAVKMAAEFEENNLALVHGAGESAANLGMIHDGLLDISNSVGADATKLSQGMYMVESAGFRGADALNVMQYAAEGAKIGMSSQADTADALTTILKDYHQGATEAAGATGQLLNVVAAGKMRMQDLAGALSTVLPTAAAENISFQELGAAIATMTAHGVDAHVATTNLKFGLTAMVSPSGPAAAAMKDLGVNIEQMKKVLMSGDLYGAFDQFNVAIDKLLPAGAKQAILDAQQSIKEGIDPEVVSKGLEEKLGPAYSKVMGALAKAFGGARGAGVALNILGNMDEFKANIAAVGTVTEGVKKEQEDWNLVTSGFNTKLDQTKESLKNMVITIGDQLLPYGKEFLDWLQNMMPSNDKLASIMTEKVIPAVKAFAMWIVDTGKKIYEFVTTHQELLINIGKLVAAFVVLGPIISIISGVIGIVSAAFTAVSAIIGLATGVAAAFGIGLGALFWPITLIVAGIAGIIIVGKLLIDHWDDVKSAAAAVWGWVTEKVGGAFSAIGTTLRNFDDMVKGWVAGVVGTITGAFRGLPDALGQIFGHIGEAIGGAFDGVGSAVHDALQNLPDAIGSIFSAIGGKFQDLKDSIGNAFSGIGNWFDWLGSVVSGKISWIRDAINNLPHLGGLIPSFDTGGVMPGGAGQPGLAILHGGERVLTPQQQASGGYGGGIGGGGVTINFQGPIYGTSQLAAQMEDVVVAAAVRAQSRGRWLAS